MTSYNKAEELLSCTLTYRSAPRRTEEVQTHFENAKEAVTTWFSVLMHEAREAMESPLEEPPTSKYLHPVDVETTEPGIVDNKDNGHVARFEAVNLPKIVYTTKTKFEDSPPQASIIINESDLEKVQLAAQKELEKNLKRAEKKAQTCHKREQKQLEEKEARTNETPEARQERLELNRQKREASQRRKAEREANHSAHVTAQTKTEKESPPFSEDAMMVSDTSISNVLDVTSLKKRRKGKINFYQHPIPHHRHMLGLQMCKPSDNILDTLLSGNENDDVECIQGPPGTGKTRELVKRVQETEGRVFLCAPTNVGAINLYLRCVFEGLQEQVSLVLSPDRIPPGTPVLSNDPKRRIVCATISARSGPQLMTEKFQNVFVDEAAQCMEAWTWTLFRNEVKRLVLAGDVKQLPALVSESGQLLNHQRSLMERLVVDLKYENVICLSEQHRMAPEIVAFPNKMCYDGALTQGSHAPKEGAVEVYCLDGIEQSVGASYRNIKEAQEVARIVSTFSDDDSVVILTPYTAQCHQILSHATRREVHTIDSFQGREADIIVLSVVRDGSVGIGFWNEVRRLTVALTRARRRLVVVVSRVDDWPDGSLLKQFVCEHKK